MIFKTPEELVEFFNKLDLNESTLVFKKDKEEVVKKEKHDCACGGTGPCQCPSTNVNEDVKVQLLQADKIIVESFSDNPEFDLKIDDDSEDNIFYVKDYEGIPDACGTGQVILNDRTSYMNMCESENKATVKLTFVIEGQRFSNVPFTLIKTENDPYLLINKKYFAHEE